MQNIKIVVPRPPYRSTTVYGGKQCISWFDVKQRGPTSFTQPLNQTLAVEHIHESFALVEKVVEAELKLVDERHMFLGGFSQGCGMSLHVAFTMNRKWAGVISVAGYLFEITPFNKEPGFPVRIFHGTSDPVRPWEEVKPSYERYGAVVEMIDKMKHKHGSKILRQKIADFIASVIRQPSL